MVKTPCKSQTDKKLKYIRYADDFIIGINGDKDDCKQIKEHLSEFIFETLKMELSEEKTLITHSGTRARFLSYDVKVRRNGQLKQRGKFSQRTLNNKVELNIPLDEKITKFMFDNNIIRQKPNGDIEHIARKSMLRCTDLEIVTSYNAELRGLCNYYSLASNFAKLDYFAYNMEYSCLKTLAAKHNSSMRKIIAKHQDGNGRWGIPYETKKGSKRCYFAKFRECSDTKNSNDVIPMNTKYSTNSRNMFESRLKAKICELCGDKKAEHYEIHHIRKVKNLKGKEFWEQMMIAKRRKTIVLCRACHHKIHNN